MEYLYILAGMFVSIIAFLKRELLVKQTSFRIILGVSAALFVAGSVLHFIDPDPYSPCGALLAPLLSLGVYRLYRKLFLLRAQHEPKDTSLNWAAGLGADRIFNIAYFGSAIWIELLTMGAMMELAKAGL
jgi:hypothetical protein